MKRQPPGWKKKQQELDAQRAARKLQARLESLRAKYGDSFGEEPEDGWEESAERMGEGVKDAGGAP